MVGIYGIIGEFSRGKSPEIVDAVGFWPTASILFCFYGAGDRTRTGTLSPAVDFESTTSTNSITPAKATCIIHEFTLICKRKITIGIGTGGLEENLAVLKILSLAS